MTSDSHDQLVNSLKEYVRDHHNEQGFLTSFFLIGEYVDDEGDECWFTATMPQQSMTKTVGLTEFAKKDVDVQVNSYLYRINAGEDDDE